MKVLIITYYWPPAGGSGVQRWLKFVKYLQNFDIEPVVYTIENPNYAIKDDFLHKNIPKNIEILKQPIWEPNAVLSFFKKRKTQQTSGFLNQNPSFFGKILQYIRANYFIPDARKFWVKSSVKYLHQYLKKYPVDLIITTGPPHSLHLIGLELKKLIDIKWMADFRDPWTEIDYFHQLPLTKKSKEKHFQLEQEVLQTADTVLVVGNTMKEKMQYFSKKIHVLTNGFDTERQVHKNFVLDITFSITHIGLMNADRNPTILWKVLTEICSENKQFLEDLEVKLIGKMALEVEKSIQKVPFKVLKIEYLAHQKVIEYQHKSQVLLLAINNVPSAKGIITGKIFEYLQAKRPILTIGPTDGDAATILQETNTGIVVDFNDKSSLKEEILKFYKQFKEKKLSVNAVNINQFHRKKLTEKLSEIIKETIA